MKKLLKKAKGISEFQDGFIFLYQLDLKESVDAEKFKAMEEKSILRKSSMNKGMEFLAIKFEDLRAIIEVDIKAKEEADVAKAKEEADIKAKEEADVAKAKEEAEIKEEAKETAKKEKSPKTGKKKKKGK